MLVAGALMLYELVLSVLMLIAPPGLKEAVGKLKVLPPIVLKLLPFNASVEAAGVAAIV